MRVAQGAVVKGGYDFQRVNRDCPGSWISCADAAVTNEHTLRAEWRANASDQSPARVGYAFSSRRTPNYNENAFLALVPYAERQPRVGGDQCRDRLFLHAGQRLERLGARARLRRRRPAT